MDTEAKMDEVMDRRNRVERNVPKGQDYSADALQDLMFNIMDDVEDGLPEQPYILQNGKFVLASNQSMATNTIGKGGRRYRKTRRTKKTRRSRRVRRTRKTRRSRR